VKHYIWSIDFNGAEIWTIYRMNQKYRDSFETWYWRKTEKNIRSNCVRCEEVLQRIKKERNILQTIKRRKANLIGHICRRNCFLNTLLKET